jgi:PAS domain S-box-containing protein
MTVESNDFALFKDYPEPAFVLDPQGVILDANSAFAHRFLVDDIDVRGLSVFDLMARRFSDPELSANRKEKMAAVISSGRHLIFDDESEGRILRHSLYPIKSDDGNVSRLLIIVRDVTEEVEAEKRARHTEHVFKALLDAIPGSVFVLDNECLLQNCNDYAFELFGNENKQILKNNFFDLIHVDDRIRMKKTLTELMECGYEESTEARMYLKADRQTTRWFTIHAQRAVIDLHTYLVIVCIDINKHKNAESQLLEYKKWLIMALEAGNTGVWDWNIVTDAALWSNRIWELYGIEREPGQYPSFNLWETSLHPDDKESTTNAIREAVNIKADLNIEYRVIHPDGSVHWIMVNGKPVYDRHGMVKRYCGTALDITDQKLFEKEIDVTREHLELALEKCNIGWFELNLKNYSVIRSLEHARIYGYDTLESEWSFESFLKHVIDEDKDRVRKHVINSISKHKDFAIEFQIAKPDGERRRIWASATIQFDNYGNATHLLGIAQDVTERLGVKV